MTATRQRGRAGRRPSVRESAAGGAVLGALLGAAVGGSRGDATAAAAAAAAGLLIGAALEVVTERDRQPASPKPEWHRIGMAAWFSAAIGGLLDLATDAVPVLVFTTALGLLVAVIGTVGLLSFKSNRLVLGIGVGLAVGGAAMILSDDPWLALLGALVALSYRLIGRVWFDSADSVQLLGDRLMQEQVPFVVPYRADGPRVGAGWARRTAADRGWGYAQNPDRIGIVESLELLRSDDFDPDEVAAGIHDFYQHTSEFELTITPVWSRRAQPLYWVFKQLIASRIGQANLPFTQAEAQRGVVSMIEALTVPTDPPNTLRVWTRSYAESGEPLYVGVYTTYQHGDAGYVSVGFPLPSGNFTATLRASNAPDGGLLLHTARDGGGHAGHYLSAIEDDGRLTVMKVPALGEEIHVFDDADGLRTEHRFLVWGQVFLSLNYTMRRKDDAPAGRDGALLARGERDDGGAL